MIVKILIGWIIFDALVYCAMWFEHIYYRKNLPAVFRKILIAFTEEE